MNIHKPRDRSHYERFSADAVNAVHGGQDSEASTEDLRQLAAAVASGDLSMPLEPSRLGYAKFGHLTTRLTPFFGLGRDAVLGVLRAVLAERRRAADKSLDLVWSGSDAGPSYARYTKIVVPEMIAKAARGRRRHSRPRLCDGAGAPVEQSRRIGRRGARIAGASSRSCSRMMTRPIRPST